MPVIGNVDYASVERDHQARSDWHDWLYRANDIFVFKSKDRVFETNFLNFEAHSCLKVWCENGGRLTDGELYLVFSQWLCTKLHCLVKDKSQESSVFNKLNEIQAAGIASSSRHAALLLVIRSHTWTALHTWLKYCLQLLAVSLLYSTPWHTDWLDMYLSGTLEYCIIISRETKWSNSSKTLKYLRAGLVA